jgi:hypothetical protein
LHSNIAFKSFAYYVNNFNHTKTYIIKHNKHNGTQCKYGEPRYDMKGMVMILFINITSKYELGYGFEIESHGLGYFINFKKCIYII